jgi:hypothetical protein
VVRATSDPSVSPTQRVTERGVALHVVLPWVQVRVSEARGMYTVFKQMKMSEISGSHGGEYEDDCLTGCCAV